MDKPNLPSNWSWVKLGDIGDVIGGGTPSTSIEEYFDGDIAWITPADLTGFKNKYISKGRRNITEAGLKNSSARLIPKNSVLFSSRAPIGYVVISSNELCTNQGFKTIIPNKKIDSEFVYYFLKSAKQLTEKNASGTTFKEISAKNFANLPIPLPPLQEQKKIVEKIEELFSGLDNGVASLKKAKEQIRLYRQSVLASAFSGKLVKDEKRETKNELEAHLNGIQVAANKSAERLNGIQEVTEQENTEHMPYKQVVPKAAEPKVEYSTSHPEFISGSEKLKQVQLDGISNQLPDGWKWVKLGEIIKVSSGKGLTSSNMVNDGLYSVYGGNGVSGYYNEFLFEEPRLIIGRVGAKCGVIHITKPKSWVTDNALIIEFISNNVEMKFLYHCLDYHNLNKLSVSTAQPVISGAKIYPYEIILPPLTQQNQIVEEIEKRFSEADNLEKTIDESLAKSEILRQSILKQAFEGKLV